MSKISTEDSELDSYHRLPILRVLSEKKIQEFDEAVAINQFPNNSSGLYFSRQHRRALTTNIYGVEDFLKLMAISSSRSFRRDQCGCGRWRQHRAEVLCGTTVLGGVFEFKRSRVDMRGRWRRSHNAHLGFRRW